MLLFMLIVLSTKIQFCGNCLLHKEFVMEKNLKIFRNQQSEIHLKPLNFGMNIDFVVTQSLKIITVHSKQSEEKCVPGIHS